MPVSLFIHLIQLIFNSIYIINKIKFKSNMNILRKLFLALFIIQFCRAKLDEYFTVVYQ